MILINLFFFLIFKHANKFIKKNETLWDGQRVKGVGQARGVKGNGWHDSFRVVKPCFLGFGLMCVCLF